MTVCSNVRLSEWDLLAELEELGYFLRVSEEIKCAVSDLKVEDVNWFKVGYIASKEGYGYPEGEGDDIYWLPKNQS